MNDNLNRFCSKCGNELRSGSAFCGVCGNMIEMRQPIPQQINNNQKNSKKIFIGIGSALGAIIILFVVLLISKNFSSSPVKNPNSAPGRTIMLYMVGSDLESKSGLATSDLSGFDYQKLASNNTKVVAMLGGAKKWYNNYVDVETTSIYELTANGFEIVDQKERRNMSDGSTFSYFLNYVYDNYKTQRYNLVFWDHGGGILGAEFDDFSNIFGTDPLSLVEMKEAFEESPFKGKNKLDSIIFRTCLNGTLEVASTLKDYTDYMVGSEEVTRGSGFTKTFFDVFNDIKMDEDGKEVGKKFVDSYMEYMKVLTGEQNLANAEIITTYSIIDMTKVERIEKSVNSFFEGIKINDKYNEVAKIRAKTLQYGEDTKEYDTIDLYNFVSELAYLSPKKADEVLKALTDAVVYNYASSELSKGLSIYFPFYGTEKNKSSFLNDYYFVDNLSSYKTFIKDFNNVQKKPTPVLSFAGNKITTATDEDSGEADFIMEITKEQQERFAKGRYIVFEKFGESWYSPLYASNSTELSGNKLKANIKGRQIVVKDSEGNMQPVLVNETSETETTIFYDVLGVVLNYLNYDDIDDWKVDNAVIKLAVDKKTNEVTMKGAYLKDETVGGNAQYIVKANLDEYDYIEFWRSKYRILDGDGNYKDDWESKGEMFGIGEYIGKFEFACEDFGKFEKYYAIFKITDTNNKVYNSNLVKMGN